MTWRLAKSLETLRVQINEAYPNRRKSSDGTIGDAQHASRSSDHNPWVKDGKTGVVTAIDFTHDPERGVNSESLANLLLASRDTRIKYIISNRKIASSTKTGGAAAWAWRKYTGSNPHSQHMHLSVKSDKASYDSTKPWNLGETPKAKPAPKLVAFQGAPQPIAAPAVEARGDKVAVQGDAEIWNIQRRLDAMKYFPGNIDGVWGGKTGGAISGFINDRQLKMAAPTSLPMFRSVQEKLKEEISKAESESYTRPIAPERAEATPAELAPTLPEVKASITAERLGFWGSVSAFFVSIFTGISKFMGDAIEWLNPIKEFAGELPWPVWVGGALLVSAALYYISTKSGDAKNAATKAFQEGARS